MKYVKVVLMGIGTLVVLTFIGGFISGLFQKPFTVNELIEVYEQGQPMDNVWVEFEVKEIVEHDMVGQSFWAVEYERVVFIVEDNNVDNVEVGDSMKVWVNNAYEMFSSYIFEFNNDTAIVIKE